MVKGYKYFVCDCSGTVNLCVWLLKERPGGQQKPLINVAGGKNVMYVITRLSELKFE